jgi:hypothetical protein
MNTNIKRKLMLWGGGLALFALFFGGSIRDTLGRIMIMRQMRAKPSPVGPAATTPPAQAPPPVTWGPVANPPKPPVAIPANGAQPTVPADPNAAPAADASFDRLLGVWEGAGMVTGSGCNVKLELRRKEGDTAHIAGFPVINCLPMTAPNPRDRNAPLQMLSRLSPLSAILTGTTVNGALQFTVDKALGKTAEGCGITSFTVTPFGEAQISVEWQDAPCQGGQLLLKKGRG